MAWPEYGVVEAHGKELDALRARLLDAVDDLPFGTPLSGAQRDSFDKAVTRVYAADAKLFPAEAAHTEVWSFHALVLAPDLALALGITVDPPPDTTEPLLGSWSAGRRVRELAPERA